MRKKYIVELTKARRERLRKLISACSITPAPPLKTALASSWAGVGERASGSMPPQRQITQKLDTTGTATMQRVRERSVNGRQASCRRSPARSRWRDALTEAWAS